MDQNPCQLCFKTSSLYVITLGPGTTSNQSESRACGDCLRRCRASAVRVSEQFPDSACDALSQWYSSRIIEDTNLSSPLCECSADGSKCDFCFLADSITLLRHQLGSPTKCVTASADSEKTENKLIALGSPFFFVCCRQIPECTSKSEELYSR